MIQCMLAVWFLVPLPCLNPAWTSGSSQFMYCWNLAWIILSITLLACECSTFTASSHLQWDSWVYTWILLPSTQTLNISPLFTHTTLPWPFLGPFWKGRPGEGIWKQTLSGNYRLLGIQCMIQKYEPRFELGTSPCPHKTPILWEELQLEDGRLEPSKALKTKLVT